MHCNLQFFKNKPLTITYAVVGKKKKKTTRKENAISEVNMNFIDLQGSTDFCACLITGNVYMFILEQT